MKSATGLLRYRAIVLLGMFVLASVLLCGTMAEAAPKIYVDTSAIDARTDMTQAEKDAVKKAMKDEIKTNLETAFGTGNVEVTDKASDKATADRSVKVDAGKGEETDKDGKKSYYWGDWVHGSSGTTVYLGTYMDVMGSDFKTGDPPKWDTAKLGKAMGTTACHEIAHSYSAGHDDRPAAAGVSNPNKMNSANSSSQIGGGLPLNQAAKDTMSKNKSEAPCKTTTNLMSTCVVADWWSDPLVAVGSLTHEAKAVTALFSFGGPAASFFDIGWWGPDSDNGALDGVPWANFICKSSMTGTPSDSPTITMFDGWTAQFVLKGRPGTIYEGQLFPVEPARLSLHNPIPRPDGEFIMRSATMDWDIDGNGTSDVFAELTTDHPLCGELNGFRLGIQPPMTVRESKATVEGTYVGLRDVVVSRVFSDCFYVQSMGRSAGVRVQMPEAMPLPPHIETGQILQLRGRLDVAENLERVLTVLYPEDVVPMGFGPVRPVGMINRSVGGSDFEYQPGLWSSGQVGVIGGTGLNNVGLFVKLWGRVKWQDMTGHLFGIDDGYGKIITCEVVDGFLEPLPEPKPYAMVIGVVSLDTTEDEVTPKLLVHVRPDIVLYD